MIMQVFTVYDAAVQAFLQPFFCRSKGEAIRSFTETCNGKEHQFNKHAADYTMFYLGEYDDSGAMFNVAVPTRVVSALECIVEDVLPPERSVNGDRRLPM